MSRGRGLCPYVENPRIYNAPPGYLEKEERVALGQFPLGSQLGLTAQVGVQNLGQGDRAISLLAVFQHGDQATPHGKARAVERMHELRLAAALGLEPAIHPARLEISTNRDR